MATVGYARVSSIGQSLDVQLEKLTAVGCEPIFQEKKSGLDGKRKELHACLQYLRKGDTLVITRIDRLARSTLHLHQIVADLTEKGVGFRVLDQAIDSTTKEGRLMFSILASIAEFETALRKERQAEGIDKAKRDGVSFGRKKALSQSDVAELQRKRADGALVRELMKEYGLAKATVYRYLGQQPNQTTNEGDHNGTQSQHRERRNTSSTPAKRPRRTGRRTRSDGK